MAAEAPIGRAVVKSAAAGQSALRAPRPRRKAAAHRPVPLRPPSRLHVEHSVDSAISLAKRSDSLSRATVFFFRDCTVRVLPEVLQNNATQKDDTLRAHQARGKSTPFRERLAAVTRPRKRASKCCHTVRGGRACSMLSLPRRTADSLPWPPRSAAATTGILVATVSLPRRDHYQDNDYDLRQGRRQ